MNLLDRAASLLRERLAYALADHLRLVEADEGEPPALDHPQHWWLARGWAETGDDIVIRPCDGS